MYDYKQVNVLYIKFHSKSVKCTRGVVVGFNPGYGPEMAACLFSRKRRSKGHERELREELLQSPRIGIENYPSRKAFATHLSDSHSSTFSN